MTTSAAHPGRPGRKFDGNRGVRGTVRRWWPLGLFLLAGLLVALATVLDTGGSSQRDAALLIGSFALYVVLPLAVLTALTVLIVRQRLRRAASTTGPSY